jgi:hypothetical protein
LQPWFALCGVEIGAKIWGSTVVGESCSAADEMVLLYKEYVEDVAVSIGFDLSRRLEIRGNRELQTGSKCGVCVVIPQNVRIAIATLVGLGVSHIALKVDV